MAAHYYALVTFLMISLAISISLTTTLVISVDMFKKC